MFDLLHRYEVIAKLLHDNDAGTLSLLRKIWGRDIDGRGFDFVNGLLEKMMHDIFQHFDLDILIKEAANAFPEDFLGGDPRNSTSWSSNRLSWIHDSIIEQLERSVSHNEANMGFHALSSLMNQRIGYLPDPDGKSYRDHEFAPAFLPYCSSLSIFNRHLINTIISSGQRHASQ